jgi:hypothetical protein
VDRLIEMLAADVVFYGDGGGKARGLPRPIYWRDRVRRLLNVFVLEISGGVTETIRSIINPDKLGHLGYPLSPITRRDS